MFLRIVHAKSNQTFYTCIVPLEKEENIKVWDILIEDNREIVLVYLDGTLIMNNALGRKLVYARVESSHHIAKANGG